MVSPVSNSNIGRQSAVSKSSADIEASFEKRIDTEILSCIILDVCGAYKPKTEFFPDKDFGEMSFMYSNIFIVGIYTYDIVAAIPWRGSIDELRMSYGVDENVIGREAVILCKNISSHSIFNGSIRFLESLKTLQPDHSLMEYHSLGYIGNVSSDGFNQIKAKKTNPNSGSGESWKLFKCKART